MTDAEALGELRRVRRVLSSSWEVLEHPHERNREPLLRLGTGQTLRICVRDRLSVERSGDPEVRSERVRASEPHQRSGPTRSSLGSDADGALEECPRPPGVACFEAIARGFDRPAEDVLA